MRPSNDYRADKGAFAPVWQAVRACSKARLSAARRQRGATTAAQSSGGAQRAAMPTNVLLQILEVHCRADKVWVVMEEAGLIDQGCAKAKGVIA